MQSGAKKPAIWPLLLILTGTALAYLPTLRYGFVYDDRYQILRNSHIESWRYFGSYFLHHVWIHQSAQGSYYRPLFLVWLRLNQWLFGYRPLGWHITTVLLHLAAVWLVYELLRRTLSNSFSVAIGTAVFALHPSHLESVAWISGVTDPLLALPLLGSVLCWINYRREGTRKFLYWSYGLAAVSLLAKETAMMIPALIFCYAVALSSEMKLYARLRDGYRAFAPYFFILAAFWFTRALVLRKEQLPSSRGVGAIFANVVPLLTFYSKHLSGLVPVGIYYDFTPVAWSWRAAMLGALAITVLLWLALLAADRSPEWLAAITWTVLPIAIASSAVTVFISEHDCVHDRYLYLATIGLGIAVGHLLSQIRWPKQQFLGKPVAQVLGALTALGVLTSSTLGQLPQWHDDVALFGYGARIAPHNPIAQKQYAYQLHLLNREEEAQQMYERVLRLDPTDSDSNFALALIAYQHEQWNQAVQFCEQTRRSAPFGYVGCYRFEIVSLENLGRLIEAETLARRAIARYPSTARQHVVLGEILAREGKPELARLEFTKELEIGESGEARIELAKLTH